MFDDTAYAYAQGYFDGRATGAPSAPFVQSDALDAAYRAGYDRGVSDYITLDEKTQ